MTAEIRISAVIVLFVLNNFLIPEQMKAVKVINILFLKKMCLSINDDDVFVETILNSKEYISNFFSRYNYHKINKLFI